MTARELLLDWLTHGTSDAEFFGYTVEEIADNILLKYAEELSDEIRSNVSYLDGTSLKVSMRLVVEELAADHIDPRVTGES